MKKKVMAGIDSGTTNNVISVVNELFGNAECIPDKDGEYLTPSVVSFYSKDEILIGREAKQNSEYKPERTKKEVKREMGKKEVAIKVDGTAYSPQQITAIMLNRKIKDAEEELDVIITKAVITVPAYFGNNEKKAVEEAGKLAGLDDVIILDEPSAIAEYAALSYDLDNKYVMVWDAGGGTTDISVLYITEDFIEQKILVGDNYLGGCDCDKALFEYVKTEFLKNNTLEIEDEQELVLKVEMAKKILSDKSEAKFTVGTNEGRVEILITRENFEKVIEEFLNKQRNLLNEAKEKMKAKGIILDVLILSGGSSRMPQIPDLAKEIFPDVEIMTVDADCAVARGAAIYAKSIENKQKYRKVKKQSIPLKELKHVSSRSYGIAAYAGDELKIFNMIKQNEPVPIEIEDRYYPRKDNPEEIRLRVFENTSSENVVSLEEGEEIIECYLKINGNISKKIPIYVKIVMEQDGTLHLRGYEKTGNTEVTTSIKAKALLSEEEFEIQKEQLDEILLLV